MAAFKVAFLLGDKMNKKLDDMLSSITEENTHPEIKTGFPLGKEVLPPYAKNDDKLEEANQEQ